MEAKINKGHMQQNEIKNMTYISTFFSCNTILLPDVSSNKSFTIECYVLKTEDWAFTKELKIFWIWLRMMDIFMNLLCVSIIGAVFSISFKSRLSTLRFFYMQSRLIVPNITEMNQNRIRNFVLFIARRMYCSSLLQNCYSLGCLFRS